MSHDTRMLRAFVNALRACLDMGPLYGSEPEERERFYQTPYPDRRNERNGGRVYPLDGNT